jgi:DNA-binding GntR family transcriptional regulator
VAPADTELAERLEVEPGHAVLSHTAVILGEDVPFLLTTRHFPADLIEDFHARLLRTGSFTALLAEAGLGALHRTSTTVGARLPAEREAALLECPRNAPLLDVTATGALADGRIVEWQHAVMNSRLIKLSFANHADAQS